MSLRQKSNKEWLSENNTYITKPASLTLYQLQRTKAVPFTFCPTNTGFLYNGTFPPPVPPLQHELYCCPGTPLHRHSQEFQVAAYPWLWCQARLHSQLICCGCWGLRLVCGVNLSQLSSSRCDTNYCTILLCPEKIQQRHSAFFLRTLRLFHVTGSAGWCPSMPSDPRVTLDPSLSGVSKAICLNSERLSLLFFFF